MDMEMLTNIALLGGIVGLLASAWFRYSNPVHLTDRRDRRHPEISSDGQAPDALRQDGRRIPSL